MYKVMYIIANKPKWILDGETPNPKLYATEQQAFDAAIIALKWPDVSSIRVIKHRGNNAR